MVTVLELVLRNRHGIELAREQVEDNYVDDMLRGLAEIAKNGLAVGHTITLECKVD